jgi:hypothetical protein
MTFKPSGRLDVESFVDADFAGLYRREPDESQNSVRSRSGYIIKLGNCPLVWKSQLQTKIALSTLQAEYSALTQCMRTLLPLRTLLIDTSKAIKHPAEVVSTIKCTAFEDNNGSLILANQQKITARTKHFLVEWHFFWDNVKNGEIEVIKVVTTEQQADYLTKGLSREAFEANRLATQGW